MYSAVPRSGVVCSGSHVTIGWPEEAEYDAITELRNRPVVRNSFLDSRLIDREANRTWLRDAPNRLDEALLSIRWSADGSFLGTIGWSSWDPLKATACFGRLMIEHDAVLRIREAMPAGYVGVTRDASAAIIDFAFERMQLQQLTASHLRGNRHAARLNREMGLTPTGTSHRLGSDGSEISTVELIMTRSDWSSSRSRRPGARSGV
jgi:RimJ/RimL family protein N-acetyltransferase